MSINMLAFSYGLQLQSFDNQTLAALYNALTGFGVVNEACCAYEPALAAEMIHSSGKPHDTESLLFALSIAIDRRIEAGTFN